MTSLITYQHLQTDIADLLRQARTAAVRSVNAIMTASYWQVGRRIVETEQKGKRRAAYGEQLIKQLALDLTAEFARGFSKQNLHQMCSFYRLWSQDKIVQTLSGEFPAHGAQTLANDAVRSDLKFTMADLARAFPLPWSAYVCLLSVESEEARAFYEHEALRAGWSVRQLKRQMDTQFFERSLLSQNKKAMLSHADAGQMHMYLNYAKAHWMRQGENPPVGLILCSQKGQAQAHYALEGLPNKVLAARYQTLLPSAEQLSQELQKASEQLAHRARA